jgi:DNA-binding CsgD family transcriptional regulator
MSGVAAKTLPSKYVMTTMTSRELSPRQREILALVAAGRTSKEIAGVLGISESTVNWHLSNAFDRLGASSRAEAVALVMREEAQNADAQAETQADAQMAAPKRPERPSLPLSAIALAVGLTLVLGMLGGALMAGWSFTAPTWPSSSVAPSTGAPQRGEPTVRPSGAGAPAQEVEAAAPDQPSVEETVPGPTTMPATLVPLPPAAPSLPTIAPALPPLVPTLETIAPTTPPVVGPLLPQVTPALPISEPAPTLSPAPSAPPGLPSLP